MAGFNLITEVDLDEKGLGPKWDFDPFST